MKPRSATRALALAAGRSAFPLCALVVISGTALWGPWVTLALAYGLWRVVGRIG